MGVAINKKSTTTEPPPKNGQQPKPPGGLNAFYWYQIFALDSAVVEVKKCSVRIKAYTHTDPSFVLLLLFLLLLLLLLLFSCKS